MSRTSRKNITQVVATQKVYRAAGYIRLSVMKGNQDHDSIENQKAIIKDVLSSKSDIELHQFYVDGNATGTSFERKGLQQMMTDIADGKINCVIVKDLSRLGRDAIEVGYYVQHLFPQKGVRFISILDIFDTIDGITDIATGIAPGLSFSAINIFNQEYAADISRKTQASIDNHIRAGKCVAAKAPFGYMKSAEDCHQLLVDPQPAEVVKEIFAMAERHIGLTEIVRRLNLAHIPTPSCTQQDDIDLTDSTWNSRTVKYILTNRTYTGDLQQGKDDVVVENTHEALVSKDVFSKIQEKFQAAGTYASTILKPIADNPLRGKVICASCGSKMQRRKGRGNVDWYSFTCITNNRKGCGCSTGMYIRETEILSVLKSEAVKKYGYGNLLLADVATIIQNQVAEVIIHKGGQIDVHFND